MVKLLIKLLNNENSLRFETPECYPDIKRKEEICKALECDQSEKVDDNEKDKKEVN